MVISNQLDLETGASNDSVHHYSTADPADAFFLIHRAIVTPQKFVLQVHTTTGIKKP